MTDRESIEYFRAREKAERAAAAATTNDIARKLHLKLAEAYAARVREGEQASAFKLRPAGGPLPASSAQNSAAAKSQQEFEKTA
ncbi:MAG TPA: hypothetical protein VEB39_06705 [Sphingomicrobium sp.]|nr:hypothetical protein [Sphingomicrobium sp.]